MVGAYDTLAASLIPFELWQGEGYYLDEHARHVPPEIRYSMTHSKTGRWVSTYPIVTPLLATPFYFPAGIWDGFGPQHPEWGPLIRILMEKGVASLIAALSVLLVYLAARRQASAQAALWAAVAYAFATPVWSISSQALWQHGPSQLLLALALYLLAPAEGAGSDAVPAAGPGRLLLLGLIAGLLTANRPQDLFYSAALLWIVVSRHGRRAWPFLLPAAAVAALLVTYNLTYFSTPFGGYADYRTPQGMGLRPSWPDPGALAGLLVSNRGLLTFCPFLLALFAMPGGGRRQRNEKLAWGLAWGATVLLFASFPGWSGGHTYGPRYLSDGLPLLAVWLALAIDRLRSGWSRALVAAAIIYSIGLQAIGAYYFPGGGSADDRRGFWTVEDSGPVLALASGPQTPYFLSYLAPSVAAEDSLPPPDARAAMRWLETPPASLQAGDAEPFSVSLTHEGSRSWSSLGGPFGEGAVRLLARWQPAGAPPGTPPVAQTDDWLARRLKPGATATRTLRVPAPFEPGRYRLILEPCQLDAQRCVPFSELGSPTPPLTAEIAVLP